MGTIMSAKTQKASSLQEMKECAQSWAKGVSDRHVLLLTGDMGVGKTQFCQYVLHSFGVEDVSSPTFSLIHSYQLPQKIIHHLDLYRLESEEDLESIGLWDLFLNPALILIEWGDKLDVRGLEHEGWTLESLNISMSKDGVRELQFQKI